MRRKGQTTLAVDPFAKPGVFFPAEHDPLLTGFLDIRTLYILFLMSFVNMTTPHSVKSLFVEQCHDHFVGIFKGLFQDPYALVCRVLEVCWESIWSDQRVKRTSKVALFGEQSLTSVCDWDLS
jgi:Ribosome 60S biogenesis N-terminal